MRQLLGSLLLVCMLPLAAEASAASAPTILVLGDSISAAYGISREQGWVRLLEKRLRAEDYDHVVVNASISGETTSGGLNRLPAALKRYQPAIVVVELGGNDALRGYPLDRISDNLSSILKLCREAGTEALLLPMRIPVNYGFDYAEGFFELFKQVASDAEVAITPFFLDGVGGVADMMQDDGIHPKAVAQTKLLENVWPTLLPLLSP